MGSEQRAISNASGSKPPPIKKVPKKSTENRWNLSAALKALILALLFAYFFSPSKEPRLPPSLLPFPGPKLTSLPQFSGSHASRMLWGTYRPDVYFGLRPRAPKSMAFGLMWLDPLRQDALSNIRHRAEMRDGLAQYGWLAHDGEGYGRQGILDEGLNITTSWVKNNKNLSSKRTTTKEESEKMVDSQDTTMGWSARIAAHPRQKGTDVNKQEQQEPGAISFFLYMATEDGSPIELHTDNIVKILSKFDSTGVLMSGNTNAIGKWKLHLSLPAAANKKFPTKNKSGGSDLKNKLEEDNNDVEKEKTTDHHPSSPAILEFSCMGLRTPHLHNLTDSVYQGLVHSIQTQYEGGKEHISLSLSNLIDPGSNVAVLQITAMLPTTLDIAFTSESGGSGNKNASGGRKGEKSDVDIVGSKLTSALDAAEQAFQSRFEKTFGQLKSSITSKLPVGTDAAARAALSNLLGGMGYWYGHSLVKLKKNQLVQTRSTTTSSDITNGIKNKKENNEEDEEIILKMWDTPLYSATPSRSFFPRGFLWDEGFHQLLVQRWNPALSRDALAHWLDLMTETGWIPREQILGEEARARVPSEFIAQSPDAANPPALFLPLAEMAERVAQHAKKHVEKKEKCVVVNVDNDDEKKNISKEEEEADVELKNVEADAEFLCAAWPRLRAWFIWYSKSQAGPVAGSFRWRGREGTEEGKFSKELNPKTLTSGLDDYPRASHPSPDERHLDLRCWMALAATSLASVGDAVGAPAEEIEEFRAFAAHLDDFEELKRLHWDEKRQKFADWGLHTEDVELVSDEKNNVDVGGWGGDDSLSRVTHSPPSLQYVPHYGYLSLFPLIMNLIPKDSPILGQQISNLREESELWTPFGLRSLSKSSSLYNAYNTRHDPPYWRGPVWININYLVLRALRRYEQQGGPYAVPAGRTADDLRTALMNTLVEQYNSRGYLYEQYNDETGQGKGSHPFTGWTALLTLIAGEEGVSAI